MAEGQSVSNVDDQGNITYGSDSLVQNAAIIKKALWGFHNIAMFPNTGEGVISGLLPDGTTGYMTSRTIVKTVDLIAEGEIDGLVTGEYKPVKIESDPDVAGQIGWKREPEFHPLGKSPESFLRSVYLNDTPIVSPGGYYNFQNVEVAFANGTHQGILKDDTFLMVGESNDIQKTRAINERLLGPDGGGEEVIDWSDPKLENPFIYNNKTYRILNKELEKLKINIKIPALMYTKQTDADIGAEEGADLTESQIEQLGEVNATTIKIYTRFRPLYQADFTGASSTASTWYGVSDDGTKPILTQVKGLIRGGYLHPIEIDVTHDGHYGKDSNNAQIKFADINTSKLVGWEFEITRLTFDSIQSNVQNQSYIDSITEIYSADMSYPNSALMAMNFNAQYFSQIPNRSFDVRLLKVKIPRTYNPIQRSYEYEEGEPVWDGTFLGEVAGTQRQWTDNPAWIYYDLLTNRRYGLGKFIEELTIDKWTLFEISKFCDTLVPDGFGGLEPRFTCNAYINTREEAYKVLQDFASVFRGIIYYGLGNIHAVQDRPREAIAQFTNTNVKDGNFQYQSSAKKARSTVCVVRYNDKENGFKPALEYTEDAEGIRKYGYIEKEVTAFACTSKAQAIRLGKWILLTELYESELCNFSTGPEASLLRPGDVIKIFDFNRYVSSEGGRVIRASQREILLDREPEIAEQGIYNLTLTTPTHFFDSSLVDTEALDFGADPKNIADLRRPYIQSAEISKADSNYTFSREVINDPQGDVYGTKITSTVDIFDSAYGEISENATWSLLENDYSDSLYTVISTKEAGSMEFQVECMEHRPDKFAAIEQGVPMDDLRPPGGETVSPTNPGGLNLYQEVLQIGGEDSHTKQLKIKITRPRKTVDGESVLDLGSTVGYRVYIKRVLGSSSATDFLPDELLTGDLPDEEFLWRTVYLAEQENQDPVIYYLPPRNNYRYIVRVFAINGSSMFSSGFVQSFLTIAGHYPVRDIRIHSLRLMGSALDESAGQEVTKPMVTPSVSKDSLVAWEVDFPVPQFKNLDLTYKISIHEPNTGSSTPIKYSGSSFGYGSFSTEAEYFDFTFALNSTLIGPKPPYRHFDLVVRAVDIDGGYSSGPNDDFSTLGWDIIELDNPRPDNYHVTPRTDTTGRPGKQVANEKMRTEQWIDAVGNIRLDIMSTEFRDLAGGFMYLSHHPFSGQHALGNGTPDYGDFDEYGRPDNYNRKLRLCTEEYAHKQGEFEILEIPFQIGDRVFRNTACCEGERQPHYSITAHPNNATNVEDPSLVFDFQNTYHLAVKFYDSFDRAIKEKHEKDTDDPKYRDWDTGMWIGFVRHRVDSQENILTKKYTMYYAPGDSTETCGHKGDFLAELDPFNSVGEDNGSIVNCFSAAYGYNETCSGLFSCPIYPTKYYSANAENGFKYWIRINVNGQWEGNGISAVKAMSWGDVQAEYGYDGFWEYACHMTEDNRTWEQPEGSDNWLTKYWPNSSSSLTRCRFRQGAWNPNSKTIVNVDDDITYSPDETPALYVTGSVRVPPDGLWPGSKPSIFGPKAGVPWESEFPDKDRIDSYNEFGEKIEGKDRPMYGYRRYRVYFDPDHLPPPFQTNQLPSYSVIGINAWNGPYESWPSINNEGDLKDNLMLAKDGINIYTHSVRSWMQAGDIFENIPGVWNHHPAGFGQGFGGLKKNQRYFDVHLGRMIDDSYLNEGFFAVVTSNDYSILEREALIDQGEPDLHVAAGFSEVYFAYDPDGDGIPGWQSGPREGEIAWPMEDPGEEEPPPTDKGKVVMDDCYEDGWHGSYINVTVNQQSAGHATMQDGDPCGTVFEFNYSEGDEIALYWHISTEDPDDVYDNEVEFVLKDKDDNVKYTSPTIEDCDDATQWGGSGDTGMDPFTNGQEIYKGNW